MTNLDVVKGSEALNTIDAAANQPVAASPDPELLRELRGASRAFDMDRVDAAMTALEAFRYENGGELVAWLRARIDDMAFEEISSVGDDELLAWAGRASNVSS